ncbi:MAG: ABC transporter permease, partial [Blastocatellia bacterium]
LEDEMFQDLRFGARMLAKSPGFTAVAALSLALGIGANTAIFSLANAVLFQTPPVADAKSVMNVIGERRDSFPVSYPDYRDYLERNRVFSDLLCWNETSLSLTAGGQAEPLAGTMVSGNYFALLGVQPALGRFFLPEEDRASGAHPVVVISHGLWQRRFGGAPDMIGQSVNLNGHPFTVIGVAPQGFTGVRAIFTTDAWVPVTMQAQLQSLAKMLNSRNVRWLKMTGRLKPGVSRVQAEADLNAVERQLNAEYPDRETLAEASPGARVENRATANPNEAPRAATAPLSVRLLPIGSLPPGPQRGLTAFIGLLLALVGLVLLIACANLSGLLLARATARRKEIAVRLALGASRWRLVRQLLTESALLCVLSGGAGVLLAAWINRALLSFKPAIQLPVELNLRLDLRVLAAALLLSLLTGLLFGLLPALQASKPDVAAALKDETYRGGARGSRLRNLFVTGQVALSFLLLVCAGLFWRALNAGQQYQSGFQPERVQTATLDPGTLRYDEPRAREFYRQLIERIRALPEVESASLAMSVSPPRMRGLAAAGKGAADPNRSPGANFNAITPGHLATLNLRLLRGRDFSEADRPGAPRVAIIDETAARQWFEGREALGQRLTNGKEEYEIVGIAERVNLGATGSAVEPLVYFPLAQSFSSRLILHMRARGAAAETNAALRNAVAALDERIPLQYTMPLSEYLRLELLPQRIVAMLAGVCGLVGLALAAIGIFGMVSYAVARRTHEIGIRMALGARSLDVLRLVMRQGIGITLAGLSLGLLGALILTRLLTRLLYGVSPTDPPTLICVSLLLAGVALLAGYLPARKAIKIDPLVALRHE